MWARKNSWASEPSLLQVILEYFVTLRNVVLAEVCSSDWQPYLFPCNQEPLFKRNEGISLGVSHDKILDDSWNISAVLFRGFSFSGILNKENALRTTEIGKLTLLSTRRNVITRKSTIILPEQAACFLSLITLISIHSPFAKHFESKM